MQDPREEQSRTEEHDAGAAALPAVSEPVPEHEAENPTGSDEPRDELHARVTQLESELNASRETVTALERRGRIDALLLDADTHDLDLARLLTERAVSEMDEPDVALAVEDLRRHKPFLFRHRPPMSRSMPPRLQDAPAPVEEAATRAAKSGHRRDLMQYLRLRSQS